MDSIIGGLHLMSAWASRLGMAKFVGVVVV